MWKYKEAKFYGKKDKPEPGDSVVMVLETDAREPEVRKFVYGYDGRKSKKDFEKMVKAEMKAHLQHLNRASVGDDVTKVFEPI